MREAAIVSTARTGIGKAYRGAFNATEAPVLAGHEGLVAAHAYGTTPGGQPFLVMDLVQGRTLEDLIDAGLELAEGVRLVRDAARAIDEGAPDAAAQCAMAKRFATDAGFDVANRALQLHGGYGYLHEYGIERVVRDLRVHRILEGSNEMMRMIVGRDLTR